VYTTKETTQTLSKWDAHLALNYYTSEELPQGRVNKGQLDEELIIKWCTTILTIPFKHGRVRRAKQSREESIRGIIMVEGNR
jgi:hypothetical protein